MTLAALSDRLRHRLSFATAPLALAIAGLSVLLSVHDHPSTQYAALFLLVIGIWSSLPVQLCWVGMNVEGQARRAVALGWQVGFGNLGGIVAVYLFLDGDAPRYTPGYATCLGFAVLAAALNGLYAMVCMRENRMQDRRSSSSNHEGANFGPEGGTHRHKDSAFRNVL